MQMDPLEKHIILIGEPHISTVIQTDGKLLRK